jgi:hypothetical protein
MTPLFFQGRQRSSTFALADGADGDAHAVEIAPAGKAAVLEPIRSRVQVLGQRHRRDLARGPAAPPVAFQRRRQREDDLLVELSHDVDAMDRRSQVITLSASGRRLVPKLAALADENDAEVFGHLEPLQRATLLSIFEVIAERHALKGAPVD